MFAIRRTLRAPVPNILLSPASVAFRPSSTSSTSGERPAIAGPKRKIKSRILHKPRPLPGGAGVCAAYCAEAAIRVDAISSYLESRSGAAGFTAGSVSVHAPDVAHAALTVHEGPVAHAAHTFFFSSGAVVFWGVPLPVRRALLRGLDELVEQHEEPDHAFSRAHGHAQRLSMRAARRTYPRTPLRLEDFDHEFSYRVQRGVTAQFRNDVIQLPTFNVLPLLAVSHGLAQSVKLAVHEQAIDMLVLRTRSLPEELALTGRTGMSQRDIKRFIGELIAARYSVSLVSDILDTPEFFWQNPELENLYLECVTAVELRQRAAILETRVQVIKDSLDMLNNELSNSSSNRVERAILALIAVEVCIEVGRLFPTMM